MMFASNHARRRLAMQCWLREARARRAALLPVQARCTMCDERDPLVLVPDHRRILCADHDALQRGQTSMQQQHVARERYGPWVVYVSANKHRRLTTRERFREKRHAS
jgi:hypothetical protein